MAGRCSCSSGTTRGTRRRLPPRSSARRGHRRSPPVAVHDGMGIVMRSIRLLRQGSQSHPDVTCQTGRSNLGGGKILLDQLVKNFSPVTAATRRIFLFFWPSKNAKRSYFGNIWFFLHTISQKKSIKLAHFHLSMQCWGNLPASVPPRVFAVCSPMTPRSDTIFLCTMLVQ